MTKYTVVHGKILKYLEDDEDVFLVAHKFSDAKKLAIGQCKDQINQFEYQLELLDKLKASDV